MTESILRKTPCLLLSYGLFAISHQAQAGFVYNEDFSSTPTGFTSNNPHGHYAVAGGVMDFTAQGFGSRTLSTHMNHAANLTNSYALSSSDTSISLSYELTTTNEQSELAFPGVGIYANDSASDFVRLGAVTTPSGSNMIRLAGFDGGTAFVSDQLGYVAGSTETLTLNIDLTTGGILAQIGTGGTLSGNLSNIVGAGNFTLSIGVDAMNPANATHGAVLGVSAFDTGAFDFDAGATTYSALSGASYLDKLSLMVVPEPSSAVLLLGAAGGLLLTRRHSRCIK